MHAMEIFNYGCCYFDNLGYAPQVYDDILKTGKLISCVATDDMHGPEAAFGGYVMIKADKLDYPTIIEALKNGSEVYGGRTRVRVVKNKVAPPFREAEFDMIYGQGISKYSEILDLAVKLDIVQKSGAWFYYENTRLGQGRDNVRKMLEQDPALCEEFKERTTNCFLLYADQQ